jgi:hypothetical protein
LAAQVVTSPPNTVWPAGREYPHFWLVYVEHIASVNSLGFGGSGVLVLTGAGTEEVAIVLLVTSGILAVDSAVLTGTGAAVETTVLTGTGAAVDSTVLTGTGAAVETTVLTGTVVPVETTVLTITVVEVETTVVVVALVEVAGLLVVVLLAGAALEKHKSENRRASNFI